MDFTVLVQNLVQHWGLLGFFLGTLVEEIIVPLPSSLIMMAGGFFLVQESAVPAAAVKIAFWLVPVGSAGIMLGSLFFYSLSYVGGEVVLHRVGKYLGLSWTQLEKVQRYFRGRKSDEITLAVLRAVPVFPGVFTSILAGLLRMPVLSFLFYGLLGSAVRVFIMALAGWYVSELYASYAQKIETWSAWFTLVLLAAGALGYVMLKKKVDQLL